MTTRGSAWSLLVVGLLGCVASSWGAETGDKQPELRARAAAYGKLPLRFEANRGQVDAKVRFMVHGRGSTLFLTPREAVLTLTKPVEATKQEKVDRPRSVVRMKMVGANPTPEIVGEAEQPGKVTYLKGNDRTKWRTAIPTYGRVRYRNVYPGTDLVYHSTPEGQVEYDFVVAPGADPGRVRLALDGITGVRSKAVPTMDGDGNLVLRTIGGSVRLRKPVVYQETHGKTHFIAGRYLVDPRTQAIGFGVVAYDTSKPLIIDPVLDYSTYLGGSDSELFPAIAVDSMNRAYVAGNTFSSDFPTVDPLKGAKSGNSDAFVARLSADGSTLEYSTYLGASDDLREGGTGIAVDASFRAYVTGFTNNSTDFPTINAAQETPGGAIDAFVARLSADGSSLEYSTYLGGNQLDGGTDIAVDTSSRAYVTGLTNSAGFPTTSNAPQGTLGGSFDAFLVRFSADGSILEYSTYLGGSASDVGAGVAVNASNQAYVFGQTTSTNFPTTTNARQATLGGGTDAFVARLSADGGSFDYSTYLGGSGDEVTTLAESLTNAGGGCHGSSIAVDSMNRCYVAGSTNSTDFPTANATQSALAGGYDAFVARLSADGSTLDYSTYLGGSGQESVVTLLDTVGGASIAVDSLNRAYVTGGTDSTDFPTTPGTLQATYAGLGDVFVARLTADGSSLEYSTYLGGGGFDEAPDIAVDAFARAYVTGMTSEVALNMTDPFPTTPGAYDTTQNGFADAFVARISTCGDGLADAGEDCDDGNLIDGDGCSSSCQKECVNPASDCPAPSQCKDAICVPTSGGGATCGTSSKSDGTACTADTNACTSDTCQQGICTAGAPLVCQAEDVCHDAGTCDPQSGACSNPVFDPIAAILANPTDVPTVLRAVQCLIFQLS
jgi:cysteine-rich repeat protein